MKPEMLSVAAVALIVALAGCGSSATTEGSKGASTGAQSPSPSPTAPTTSAAPDATSTSPDASAPAAEPVAITIKGFKYTVPASVAPGAKVTLKNGDGEKHTLTSAPKGVFDVAAFGGETATFSAPMKPGVYKFTCTLHADMNGTLVVR